MLFDEIAGIAAGVFELDPILIDRATSQENCEAWSSLAHMTLMAALEDRFETRLSMEEMMEMTSIADIERVLDTRVAAA